MPRTKISEFSATAGSNTDIDGINIAEGCSPSGINDAIRELMAQLKDFQAGTAGDSFNGPVGTTTAAAGAFTNLSASGTFALTGDQVQISEGGTGQTTANAAFNALAPSQSTHAGKYLKTDGTNTSWDALDISTADITGTLPVANGGTGVTTSTGTGNVVLSSSPTLVTPNLGTPSAVTLTNATGLPISTGVSGLGTGVATFLATPSSANLASMVTDETGTGALVFAGSPTFTGTVNGAALTLSSSLTLNGGTANGIAYLNGSKVLTTGSALSFDGFSQTITVATNGVGFRAKGSASGTNIAATTSRGGTIGLYNLDATNGNASAVEFYNSNELTSSFIAGVNTSHASRTGEIVFGVANGSAPSESMRLTSTGLGIGTSSPAFKLDVRGSSGTGISFIETSSGNSNRVQLGTGAGFGFINADAGAGSISLALQVSGSTKATLDSSGNLLLNGTSAGASSVGTFAIFNGTAPTGSVTNGIILYAEDVSSSSELKVRDEAGNVTTLSPHNFSLIPDGPSEDMAWAYYSEKGGKRINVDMLKLARMVEKLTGEKLVYES